MKKRFAIRDDRGRWISTYETGMIVGQRYIASAVFAKNLDTLSDYLINSRPAKTPT